MDKDQLIASALSMGFEHKDVADAIAAGCTDLEGVVACIMDNVRPALHLGPPRGFENAFGRFESAPSVLQPATSMLEGDVKTAPDIGAITSETSSSQAPEEGAKVKSRYVSSKKDYIAQARLKEAEEVRRVKRQMDQTKKHTLAQIQEDRLRMKGKRLHQSTPQCHDGSVTSDEIPNVATAPAARSSQVTFQLRVPQLSTWNGQSPLRVSLPLSSPLSALFDFTKQNVGVADMQFIQMFPKRVYTTYEAHQTLSELGLTGNVALTVKAIENGEGANHGLASSTAEQMQLDDSSDVLFSPARNPWGHGRHLADPGITIPADSASDGDAMSDTGTPDTDTLDPTSRTAAASSSHGEQLLHNISGRADGSSTFSRHAWGRGQRLDPAQTATRSGSPTSPPTVETTQTPSLAPDDDSDDSDSLHEGSDNDDNIAINPTMGGHRLDAPPSSNMPPHLTDTQMQGRPGGNRTRQVPKLSDIALARVLKVITKGKSTGFLNTLPTGFKFMRYLPGKVVEKLVIGVLSTYGGPPGWVWSLFKGSGVQELALEAVAARITDTILVSLAVAFPDLRVLKLPGCTQVTSHGWDAIAKLTELEVLDVSGSRMKDLACLRSLRHLKVVNLSATKVDPSSLLHLPNSVEELNLSSIDLRKASMLLATLPSALRWLSVQQTELPLQTFPSASSLVTVLPQLVYLDASHTAVDLSTLLRIPSLESLHVTGCPLTSEDITVLIQRLPLAELPDFRHSLSAFPSVLKAVYTHLPNTMIRLCIDNYPVTDEMLDGMQSLQKLETLSLSGSKVTTRGLAAIGTMTHLTELYLDRTDVDDNVIQYLQPSYEA
ncbi:hypothetical protein HDU85_004955 [Gaertneriomyces sp. JEL0708]|nr:hypothetical protein HDU85_004955 [Gaertneriomyces sp. JEL0708]